MELFQVWHEINNSLTAVNLTLEFLQRSGAEISPIELQDEIKFSLESLDYVKHVIQFASEQAQNIDVLAVIESVSAILKRKWPNFELQLIKKYADWEVYGHKTAMVQVFMNLIANAIESYENEPLGSKLRVKVTLKKAKNDGIEVRIRDWGRGVPNSAKDHIFEEFFTLKKDRGGSGIGLALCKKIVEEEFRGKLSFTSEVGKGSEFKVTLPFRKSNLD